MSITCPTCGGAMHEQPRAVEYVAEYRIDRPNTRIFRSDVELQLTTKDYGLACLLLTNVGRVLTRQLIYETVWPAEKAWEPQSTRTIDTHISRVRFKLGLTPENGWALTPVYGRGYCLRRTMREAA